MGSRAATIRGQEHEQSNELEQGGGVRGKPGGVFQVIKDKTSLKFSLTCTKSSRKKGGGKYYKCGRYYPSATKIVSRIVSKKEIFNTIIPGFINILYAKVADLLKSKAHLTKEGLERIKIIKLICKIEEKIKVPKDRPFI